jgi:hypothetical protein
VITPHGLMLFVRGTDDRIYQNILPILETRWLGWTEVPGDGLTISKPAPIEYEGDLRLFVRGTDDRIYENGFDIEKIDWSGWTEVPGGGLTIGEPSGVVDGRILKLFVTGTDDAIYENDFDNRTGMWSRWFRVSEGDLTSTAPAAQPDDLVFPIALFFRTEDDRIVQCGWLHSSCSLGVARTIGAPRGGTSGRARQRQFALCG